jgi:hypothetical protein
MLSCFEGEQSSLTRLMASLSIRAGRVNRVHLETCPTVSRKLNFVGAVHEQPFYLPTYPISYLNVVGAFN